MPNRRQFFAGCTALALTASLKPALALGAPLRSQEILLEDINFPDFAANLNTPFRVFAESRPVAELRLVVARLLAPGGLAVANSGDARNEKFSLLFANRGRAALPAGIYGFDHGEIGRFEMFIAPVGPAEPGGCCYEAVFNRPVAGVIAPVSQRSENCILKSNPPRNS